jgi:dTDP-4-dehydrorhamnose 3,5-epimerase
MKFYDVKIPGVKIIENQIFKDERGKFVKHFQNSLFLNEKIEFNIDETFYSVSNKGVIRGMHFQEPPFTQKKLVFCPVGKIFDVILDLRVNSPTYRQFITVELSNLNSKAVFIPDGCAHGFQSLEDGSITVYAQSNEFNSLYDSGVSPLSLPINWPIEDFIISEKDKKLISYKSFKSRFNI